MRFWHKHSYLVSCHSKNNSLPPWSGGKRLLFGDIESLWVDVGQGEFMKTSETPGASQNRTAYSARKEDTNGNQDPLHLFSDQPKRLIEGKFIVRGHMFFHHCRVGERIVSLNSTRPDWWTNPNLVPSELQIHCFLPSIIHQTHVLSNYTSLNVLDFSLWTYHKCVPPNKKKSTFHVIPTFKGI